MVHRPYVYVNPTSFCQVDASWKREFKFETTASGRLATLPVAARVSVAMGRGVVVCADVQQKRFAVRTVRDASPQLFSLSVSTKSLPILSLLGVRVSVVGKATAVQQANVSTSPLRVHNEGIDVLLDVLLDADVDTSGLRVSVLRPQMLEGDLEISRVEVESGALL